MSKEEPFSIDSEHLSKQAAFSQEAFGPDLTVDSCLHHISLELEEVRQAPDDLHEWSDIIILAFDGALRRGFTPQQILDAIRDKQAINQTRNWPDWRTADLDKAILHDKD